MTRSSRNSPTDRGDPDHVSPQAALTYLKESIRNGQLVVIVGTGVSIGLTDGKYPVLSWKGLIENGFRHCVAKNLITRTQAKNWDKHLQADDLDELVGAAEFMGRKLNSPDGDLYARWLENVFKDVEPTNERLMDAIRAIHALGVPFCTLNYDHLLERVTGLRPINLNQKREAVEWLRMTSGKDSGVFHIHGSWDAPITCILGIRDYQTTFGDDVRDLIQQNLVSLKRLLFIGCGDTFADPNFTSLIAWLRKNIGPASLQHYALVKDNELGARNADPAWQGFVEPVNYGSDHSDLPEFLLKLFPAPTTSEDLTSSSSKAFVSNNQHTRLLQSYREFLLADCGRMTLEGVQADMNTAQQRIDLERLFVPLKVRPSLPETRLNDPCPEKSLLERHKQNEKPPSFGKVFAETERLALLALPGGGKTVLLKRLAVAYADPARRCESEDELPDLDLTPVLIRCREWRKHLESPIATLLRDIPNITGRSDLEGLKDALLPLFEKGDILLLVDGLDEIHNDATRRTFVRHLEEFLDNYKRTRLVVTSREAGFSLVAPTLSRLCKRWHIAPLDDKAIIALCGHWHRLMKGGSPESLREGQMMAKKLLENRALLRLAENPLLLTMLLVVKHGSGRLPPDRVSLYGRAVEVLLDTWNIEGHEPLNLKEAVPQLAYVAFELMRAGKQTATEKELLRFLEEARDRVSRIQLYAKDPPDRFLKRVELRSSLIVEAGHQVEGGYTVPFYQFRHRTFQEYLAAMAAEEGYYKECKEGDTLLSPLSPYLVEDEWKEVIPMAAVLAKKQAEQLLLQLIEQGNELREKVESNQDFAAQEELIDKVIELPAPIDRLIQCLVEEAEFSTKSLSASLKLASFFARGCISQADWESLARGPYGEEFVHQLWLLYNPMKWPSESMIDLTFVKMAYWRQQEKIKNYSDMVLEIQRTFAENSNEKIGVALFTTIGLFYHPFPPERIPADSMFTSIETLLYHESQSIWAPAAKAWDKIRIIFERKCTNLVLDRLWTLSICNAHKFSSMCVRSALLNVLLQKERREWKAELTETETERMKAFIQDRDDAYSSLFGSAIAFHIKSMMPDEELASHLKKLRDHNLRKGNRSADFLLPISFMLNKLEGAGQNS